MYRLYSDQVSTMHVNTHNFSTKSTDCTATGNMEIRALIQLLRCWRVIHFSTIQHEAVEKQAACIHIIQWYYQWQRYDVHIVPAVGNNNDIQHQQAAMPSHFWSWNQRKFGIVVWKMMIVCQNNFQLISCSIINQLMLQLKFSDSQFYHCLILQNTTARNTTRHHSFNLQPTVLQHSSITLSLLSECPTLSEIWEPGMLDEYKPWSLSTLTPQTHTSWSKSGPPTKASLPTLQSWWRPCPSGSGPVPTWRSCGWGRPWRTRTAGWERSWPACAPTLRLCWTLPASPRRSWCSVVCCGE